jgi:hypothetical protein
MNQAGRKTFALGLRLVQRPSAIPRMHRFDIGHRWVSKKPNSGVPTPPLFVGEAAPLRKCPTHVKLSNVSRQNPCLSVLRDFLAEGLAASHRARDPRLDMAIPRYLTLARYLGLDEFSSSLAFPARRIKYSALSASKVHTVCSLASQHTHHSIFPSSPFSISLPNKLT